MAAGLLVDPAKDQHLRKLLGTKRWESQWHGRLRTDQADQERCWPLTSRFINMLHHVASFLLEHSLIGLSDQTTGKAAKMSTQILANHENIVEICRIIVEWLSIIVYQIVESCANCLLLRLCSDTCSDNVSGPYGAVQVAHLWDRINYLEKRCRSYVHFLSSQQTSQNDSPNGTMEKPWEAWILPWNIMKRSFA